MTKSIIQILIAYAMLMYSTLEACLATAKEQSSLVLSGKLSMKDFLADPTAETSPKLLVGIVVALTIGLIVIGYLFPVGMTAYHSINFTAAGMTSDEQSLYGVLGIFALLCLLLAFIGIAMAAHDN
jgi:hypothetical protein